MPLVAYWVEKQYREDRRRGFDCCFNSNSKKFQTVGIGDTVWLFSKIQQKEMEDSFPLVGKLIVEARSANRRGSGWKYRIHGCLILTEYYESTEQGSIEEILRAAGMGRPDKLLGYSFQGPSGVKEITPETHNKLTEYSKSLKTLNIASRNPK